MIRKLKSFLFGTLPSPQDATLFYNGAGAFSAPTAPPVAGAVANTFLISGGQVAWDSAYVFRVSNASYYINGTQYSSAEGTITLTAAHASLDRIDVIALDTNGAVVKIDGTAASTPSEPSVDPALYLKLALVLVVAATSAPPTIVTENVYIDAAGPPTEWTWTSSGGSIVVNSTSNPHTGTKDIEGTNVVAAVNAKGITAAPIQPNNYDNLRLFIRSKAAWNNSRGLLVTLRSGGVLVGATLQLRRTGTYGFDSTQTSSYQQVSIPISAFAIPIGTTIDELRFEDFGGSIGFYIDTISFQVNGTGASNNNGLTQAQTDALYAPLVHATRHQSGGADALTTTRQITVIIDNGASVITTGYKAWLSMPIGGTITKARLLADVGGAIVIDVWKDSYANYPPVDADSITASAPPTITATNTKSEDSTLTGWTKTFVAGDVFGFNVDSVTTIKKVVLTLEFTSAL